MNNKTSLIVFTLALFVFGIPTSNSVAQDNRPPAESTAPESSTQDKSDKSESPKTDSEEESKDRGAKDNKQNNAEKGESDGKKQEKEKAQPKKKPDAKSKAKSGSDDAPKKKDDEAVKQASEWATNLFGGSRNRSSVHSKRSKEFLSIFDPVIASAASSTVKIMSGRRQLALGVVVDTNGYVLTKASELKGSISCKLPDGRQASASVVGVDKETDLAMLQVHVDGLHAVQWSDGPSPSVGQWLANPNGKSSKLEIGIVSVNSREIPPSRPIIGINMDLDYDKGGVKITKVEPSSPADSANLWINDVITHLDDIELKDAAAMRDELKNYDAGDRAVLTVKRGSRELKIKLTLGERDKISPMNNRSNQQNRMGSTPSRRRKDFPLAFQHDSMLSAITCGGPVVDLEGRVVGINIARAGRVASLSLPVKTVLPLIEMLKSGELAPQVVNKERLIEIDQELADIANRQTRLPSKKEAFERKLAIEEARLDEVEKSLAEAKKLLTIAQNRMKATKLKTDSYRTEFNSIKKELEDVEKLRQRLEADRRQLATGVR
jgi:S1-C subfamily serine protease